MIPMSRPVPRAPDAPAVAAPIRSATVLGVPLALTDYAGTLDWIDAAVERGHRGYLCVAAVHTVMACQEDPELRRAVLGADFTVPDGTPLVWALRLLDRRERQLGYSNVTVLAQRLGLQRIEQGVPVGG